MKDSIKNLLEIKRSNYRTFTKEEVDGIFEFSKRLLSEGIQQPILIAEFPDGSRKLIDGERRLRAAQMTEDVIKKVAAYKKFQAIEELEYKIIKVGDEKEFARRQLAANLDRQNTSIVDDGEAFTAYMEAGGKKLDLLKTINFPIGIKTKNARVDFINQRIEISKMADFVKKAVRKGLFKEYKSKPHQVLFLKDYPVEMQKKVVDFLCEKAKQFTTEELEKVISGFSLNLSNACFDIENESYPGGACLSCSAMKIKEKETWLGEKEQIKTCYNTSCAERKTEYSLSASMKEATEKDPKWVWIGKKHPLDKWEKDSIPEIIEKNGIKRRIVHGFVEAKEGASQHVILGVGTKYAPREIRNKAIWICPVESKCLVHFPKLEEKRKERREERKKSSNFKAKEAARKEAAEVVIPLAIENQTSINSSVFIAVLARHFFRHLSDKAQEKVMKFMDQSFNSYWNFEWEKIKDWNKFSLICAMVSLQEEAVFSNGDNFFKQISQLINPVLLKKFKNEFKKKGKEFSDENSKEILNEIDYELLSENFLDAKMKELEEKENRTKTRLRKESEKISKQYIFLTRVIPADFPDIDWESNISIETVVKNYDNYLELVKGLGISQVIQKRYSDPADRCGIVNILKGRKNELENYASKNEIIETNPETKKKSGNQKSNKKTTKSVNNEPVPVS